MKHYWWKDFLDRDSRWQGLELQVRQGDGQAMEMQSGHHGRMTLQVNGKPLFWATVLKNHGGVWLVFNADHPAQQLLLPAINSAEVESAKRAGRENWIGHWCRYFARELARPTPLIAPGRWLLRPMEQIKPAAPCVLNQRLPFEQWRFQTPACSEQAGISWTLYSEDFPDLQAPEKVKLVDWWWGGYLLLARYPVDPDSGRVKWWRKKSREGVLPPVLVWFIGGLASFVILDGHDRLQAALAEGVQPQFLVLSQIQEQVYTPDKEAQDRVLRSLALQQKKPGGININAINKTLINLYDTRYTRAVTCSRAILDGKDWEREVRDYLQRHHLEHYLATILAREEQSA
ncbi:hypothetical protein [Erwinia sp. CGal63]|uniref:hypothetical protein n=1 Tax=Erwinia sp. CGal63 TaxID=2919889 RepID=UPI00300A5E54